MRADFARRGVSADAEAIIGITGLAGLAGSRIYHLLQDENRPDFFEHPLAQLFSTMGFAFVGAILGGFIALVLLARRFRIPMLLMLDAASPAAAMGYGIGRIGCQVSGDGDWGIVNSAYYSGPNAKPVLAGAGDFERVLQQSREVFLPQFGGLDKVPHLAVKAPSFLPDWLFAYSYPHNVINEGVRLPGCDGQYCSYLPLPVFPTPFYETVVCIGLFFLIWSLRKRFNIPGTLFAFYLIVNGIERFLVEKIRVNTKYDIFGFRPTQAEIISSLLVISGFAIMFVLRRRKKDPAAPPPAEPIPS